jgi:PAS domain S-box-containing protein
MFDAPNATTGQTNDEVIGEDFRLLFESSPDVLLVLLPDAPRYTMVAATNARLEATQTTHEQTIGRPLFDLFPDNPSDPNATGTSNLRASLDRVLATRISDTMAVQRYDIRGPDGTFQTKHWSPKNIPILSPSGKLLYILHRVEDVTELVQATELGEVLRDKTHAMEREVIRRSHELDTANRELREANEKLGQLDAAKTAFFNNVSHEFRTPLTLMLGPIEEALRDETSTLGGEDLRTVHRNAIRLLRLVNSLLEFSRLEAGRQHSTFTPTDLAELTSGIAGAFQSLIESAGMKLVIDCPALSQKIYVDHSHWEKIVSNLLSNAFKFTFAGQITVMLSERNDHAELAVNDTGIGIPEQALPHLFERFHRVDGSHGRSFEGTGIGLALVHELTVLHGGSVRAESSLGKGSTFVVSIPFGSDHLPKEHLGTTEGAQCNGITAQTLLEASQWITGTTFAPPSEHSPDKEPQRKRILVAEDNADLRRYLSSLLSREWTVDAVADGEAAIERVRAALPDLVLSDVMMPRRDGFSLLRALRGSPTTRGIPVILLSAHAGEESVVAGLETGADDYLPKPFSARELVSRVRGLLEASQARTSALRASETRFKRLAESGMVGITVSDAKGQVLEANDTFLRMVGCSRDELLAGEVVWELLVRAGEDPTTASLPWEGEYRRHDGRSIPVLVVVAPLENEEHIAIALDLTGRKKLEKQLLQAQKMEAVGRLAGGVAHDFNNILSVILSYAEMVGAELRPDEPLLAEVKEIRTAATRGTDLTRQLLAFSRQQVLEPRVLSLDSSVNDMVKMLHRLLGADIKLTVLSDPELFSIKADPGQIEQILMNLAVNARDAMPQGGALTIRTSNVTIDEEYANAHHDVKPGSYVMLAVSDTGVGMDAQTQSRIFEPFFTTKEKGKGTGLGLATVFGIVKQSDGHIWVYSELGRGTTFKLYFPRTTNALKKLPSERPPPESVRGNETVLLVEDDAQVRTLARNILRRSGYVVLEAANGGEALLLCEQHGAKIDLVLTDVVLPLMSGRQIVERLRAIRPKLRVLFMSGYTDDAILQHGLLDSGVSFLQKPLTPTTLRRKVREVLDRNSIREP